MATPRPFLLAAERAYSTTPTSVLQVLNDTTPWWLELLEAKVVNEEHRRNIEYIMKEKTEDELRF